MHRHVALCALLLTAASCGPASMSGELFGEGFAPKDAVVVKNEQVAGLENATIVISEQSGLCAADPPLEEPNTGFLHATIYGKLEPGTFEVVKDIADVSGGKAFVIGGRSDGSCALGDDDTAVATKGSVTIEAIELRQGARTKGSLAVTVKGEEITGTFDVPWCDAVAEAAGADKKGCGD